MDSPSVVKPVSSYRAFANLKTILAAPALWMRTQDDQMKCPNCGWFGLRESGEGIECKTCGYKLTPGQVDKFRLFRLLREESKRS